MKINEMEIKKFCDFMNECIIPGDDARVDFEWFYQPYNQFPVYVTKDQFKVVHAIEGLLSLLTWPYDEDWDRNHGVSLTINGRRLRIVDYTNASDASYLIDMDTGVVYAEILDEGVFPVSEEEFLNEPFTW